MPAEPVSSGAQAQAPVTRLRSGRRGRRALARLSSSAAQTQLPPGSTSAISSAGARRAGAAGRRRAAHCQVPETRLAIWPSGQESAPSVSWSVAVVTTSTPSILSVRVPRRSCGSRSSRGSPTGGRASPGGGGCRSAPFASPSRTRSAPADSLRATRPAPAGEWLRPRTPKALPELSGFSPRMAATPVATLGVRAAAGCARRVGPATASRAIGAPRRPWSRKSDRSLRPRSPSPRASRQRSRVARAAATSSSLGAPGTRKRRGSAHSDPRWSWFGESVPSARTVQA